MTRNPNRSPIHLRLLNLMKEMGPKRVMARGQEALYHLRLIPKVQKRIMLWSIIGILLTFVSAISSHLAKDWCSKKSDLFISPNFKYPMEHQWYLFFAGWKVFNLIQAWVNVKLAMMIGDTMFLFLVVIFGYILIDNVMFWWDFNDSFYLYLDLLWTLFVLLRRCVFPYKPETLAKIKSLF
jgi:hypothetical protein